jgi:Pyruvate/2-oxoacid:ferredoxin oxidoreductase delta subunit
VNPPLPHLVLRDGNGAPPPVGERFAAVLALLEQGFTLTCAGPEPEPVPPAETPDAMLLDWPALCGADPAARAAELAAPARAREAADARPWLPWFPVIDYARCTHCMQCLSFCLFGVYGADADKHLHVEHPDQCKTNCPACSRVCPEAAIMFPKYKAGPINGDAVQDADLQREKMKIDISALLGGDVYALLRARSERARSRFSKERDADKALAERQKCLAQIAADVPPEVLMSLPSPEEIARRAEEAAARARAAPPGV